MKIMDKEPLDMKRKKRKKKWDFLTMYETV